MKKYSTNFIAIDFETATSLRSSICEVGICVVKNAKIVDTNSWLVRPQNNYYQEWNIKVHGIKPEDTENAPSFNEIWNNIQNKYIRKNNTFVAHNASFDRSCLEKCADLYNITLPTINWICTLQTARKIFNFESNKLDYLCNKLDIELGKHHRAADDAQMCAKLYLKQLQMQNII